MKSVRKICVVTGTRAEYGLLRPTLDRLRQCPNAELVLIATGSHLSSSLGRTIDQIRNDGLRVDAEVDMLLDSDSKWTYASEIGICMMSMSSEFRHLNPDIVLLLGDRFEILAAAQAAFFSGIPLAHIHGGEITRGALDDCIRHAVTKFSNLHFVSTAEHRRRVMQLGEPASTVFNVGAPGLENIAKLKLDDKAAFATRIGHSVGDGPTFILTYHPVTSGEEDPAVGIEAILEAIKHFPTATVIATGSNADSGGRAIQARIQAAQSEFGSRLLFFQSLGQLGYLSALSHASVVLGNSSSGIIEAPSMGVPTVNIGTRQLGRPQAPSVINCRPVANEIVGALKTALSLEHSNLSAQRVSPYVCRNYDVSKRIVDVLLSADLAKLRRPKVFADVDFHVEDEA